MSLQCSRGRILERAKSHAGNVQMAINFLPIALWQRQTFCSRVQLAYGVLTANTKVRGCVSFFGDILNVLRDLFVDKCEFFRAKMSISNAQQSKDHYLKQILIKTVAENRVDDLRKIFAVEVWPQRRLGIDYHLLVTAIRLGFKDIANVLLDNGARVYMKPNDNTPLHMAAARSHDWLPFIERLLEQGASVTDKNSLQDTPLHVAFSHEAFDSKTDLLLRHYLAKSQKNVVNATGLSFLHIACSRPHLEFVQKIVGAYKNSVNCIVIQSKCTPLHFAVEYGRHEIAEYLVQKGADVYRQNCDGSTPMHFALKHRNIRMADMLLASDVDRKNVVNKYGLSHFMVACIGTNLDVVKDYLSAAETRYKTPSHQLVTAKINSHSDCVGFTALHFAADFGTIEVVEFLLDRGADCCAVGVNGLTPHAMADERKREDVWKVLREHCRVVQRCRKMMTKRTDFGRYGGDYERVAVIESAREIKYLRVTLVNLMRENFVQKGLERVADGRVDIDELWDSV